MDNIMLWNILLTVLCTAFGWAFNKMFLEVKRLQILLNKTREDYLPRNDFKTELNQILDYLRRLEDKLDRHMEGKNAK